jgi:hypothetical protein
MSNTEKKKIFLKKRKRRTFTDASRFYIDKEEYSKELDKFTKNRKVSDRLAELFMLHVSRISSAHNFKDYTFKSDMEGTALIHLLKYSHNYEIDKGDAFSYCTSIIIYAFMQVINKEKRQSLIKDALIKNQAKTSQHKLSFSISED